MTDVQVAKLVGVHAQTIRSWADEPEFQAGLQDVLNRHLELLEDGLLAGELAALEVMQAALTANDSNGKPDWDIRIKAAARFLDAAGRRGKPVEQTEAKVLSISGSLDDAIKAALHDPTVREMLKREAPQFLLAPVEGGGAGSPAENLTEQEKYERARESLFGPRPQIGGTSAAESEGSLN